MLDNVDVVVTDSPLLLNTVYLKENAPEYIESVFLNMRIITTIMLLLSVTCLSNLSKRAEFIILKKA